MANQLASSESSSCAPSCSASTPYARYDVFVNHRGPDVKKTFVSHLYRRLLDQGLQVFLDRQELLQGHQIKRQIEAAIQVASVHVAIFSPTYAESRWCLDELVLMVESKAKILPVFYKVKPSDLRQTRKDGAYAKALRNHEQKKTFDSESGEEKPRYDSETIRNWRKALDDCVEISGFELDGDEEELLSKVVQGVLKNVSKPPFNVAQYPSGLEEKLQDLETTVLNRHEGAMRARVVGIVGCGGIGKTTLAKEFFNRKRSDYRESSFLFDVRETSARKSLSYLQSKLLKDLKHTNNIKIDSPDQGIGILNRYLSSCQALVILDDIDNVHQLEMLLPIKYILSPESLILVTSRDKHVLKSAGVSSIYNLTALNTPHSKELFCSYAFFKRFPPSEFAELVDQFVTACGGLPLSLKVIGALLCGQDQKLYWEEQFDRLRETVPEEIQKILRISYDSLSIQDKPIFLDIACFFLGEKKDKAIRIWGAVGVRNLEDKCLLEVNSENKIRMHDHIRDCARSIADEESMPRRLWQGTRKMIDDFLEKSSTVKTEVRGITTRISSSFSDILEWTECGQLIIYPSRIASRMLFFRGSEMMHVVNNIDFPGMNNLRLLATEDVFLEGILRRVQSPQLIWLRWYGCSRSSLPDWIPMKNLRVLEVVGYSLKSLWQHQREAPVQLRELNIWAPLSEFPKSIGQLKHLEWIIIGCPAASNLSLFCGVTTLPEEFCSLKSLKYLMLIGFSALMSLPDSFGNLTNLQHISLHGAMSLKMLPDSFGDLTRLKHLSLWWCSNLIISNETLGNITTLEYLDLSGCTKVKELPRQVAHQQSLKVLYLEYTNFKELPCNIGGLCNLEVLKIGKREPDNSSPKLNCLPDSLTMLTQLRDLSLGSLGIEYLPQGLPKMNNLESLEICYCPLRELPLLLKGGRAWNKLDPANDNCMFGLQSLYIEGTKISEVAFPEGVCPNLQCLCLTNCEELRQIGGLCGLAKLNKLFVESCVEVEELPSLETLRYLEEIKVDGCTKLKSIQGLAQLTGLRLLDVSGCKEIVGLPGVEQCTSLQSLNASECPKLEGIPVLGYLTKLRHLDVSGCHEIVGFSGMAQCTRLEHLDASKCPKLKSITGLGQLTNLRRLYVRGCHEIVGLPGVEHCTSLEELDARDCPKLQWGGGVIQQLRQILGTGFKIDVKQHRRRKLQKIKRRK